MDNNCCGSQLYHTGVCCNDEIIVELLNEEINQKEVKALKDCACQGLGPCQCDTESKESTSDYESLQYAPHSCECGGNCGC